MQRAHRAAEDLFFRPRCLVDNGRGRFRGIAAGKQFTVEQGKVYPIEILVSEGPGGEFGMTLLLEEVGMAPMSKDPKTGAPILPLFRTNYGVPKPDKNKEYVPFDEIGIVWESIK